MHRPFILRVLPLKFRQIVWSRFYRPTPRPLFGLFDAAPLDFAPGAAMKLLPGDVISDSIALTGVYDCHLTKWLTQVARDEGGVFVDVGANLGYFSLVWCAQNERNRAMAFEASPRNVDLLRHNVVLSGLQDRIVVSDQAIGASRGKAQFGLGPADQTGWGGFTSDESTEAISVDVVPLDEVLSDRSEITVLKIDIEGADTWALRGAEQILREHRVRHVWWEENKVRIRKLGIAVGESQAFMRSVGYEPVAQGDPVAELVNWYATPRDN